MKWIKITEKMPEPEKPVLVYDSKNVIRARFIPKFYIEDEWGNFLGELDYNKETDLFYWPEGWYEWNAYEEIHWLLTNKVTHWMELPRYPKN